MLEGKKKEERGAARAVLLFSDLVVGVGKNMEMV
jgi:hypothetical protein